MKHAKTKWSYENRFELTGIRFSFFFTVKELTYIGPAVPLSGNTIKTQYRLQQTLVYIFAGNTSASHIFSHLC